MQISILRGCGSKRAEVNINLAWECCTTPAFLQLETSFSLAEEPCSESKEVKIPPHWSRSSALAGKWLLQLLQWPLLLLGSLRGRKCPAFRSGSGRLWRKGCSSKLAVVFDSMGTVGQLGWFFAGSGVLWIERQIVHGRRNGVWELYLAGFFPLVSFLPFSHLAGVVLPRYLFSLQKCLGQQRSTVI